MKKFKCGDKVTTDRKGREGEKVGTITRIEYCGQDDTMPNYIEITFADWDYVTRPVEKVHHARNAS